MASQLCRRLAELKGGAEEEPLRQCAAAYEKWAIGVLDHVSSRSEAVKALCTFRSEWERSPIEEAIFGNDGSDKDSCFAFVAHRHCQYVLDAVWCGNYDGSNAVIRKEAPAAAAALRRSPS